MTPLSYDIKQWFVLLTHSGMAIIGFPILVIDDILILIQKNLSIIVTVPEDVLAPNFDIISWDFLGA